jgi:hypothetical protein
MSPQIYADEVASGDEQMQQRTNIRHEFAWELAAA